MRTKYKRVKRDGKVYLISSQDGGKTWSKPKLYNSKEHKETLKQEKANTVTRHPFHRKHGDAAEKRRILSLSHLSDREKKQKIKNLNVPDSKKNGTTKKLTGAERAKQLAKKNIKKHGGTASAAAANKAAMRLKIKNAYLAKKKKKKK